MDARHPRCGEWTEKRRRPAPEKSRHAILRHLISRGLRAMALFRERMKSKQSLDVGAVAAGEPLSPREDKGKTRSPRGPEPAREQSPRQHKEQGGRSPHRNRRDSDPGKDKAEKSRHVATDERA